MKPIIAFAHRGASAYAPENTLAAFQLALQQGANGLESDTWLALDGVPVLVHDGQIECQGLPVDIRQTPSAQLNALGIPSLAGLYQQCGSAFEFSLDVQHPESALPALRVAQQFGAEARLWLCHGSLDLLAGLRRQSAAVRLVHSTERKKIQGALGAHAAHLAALRIDVLNMHWTQWTPRLVHAVQRQGVLAFAWGAQTPEVIRQALGMGVDAIYSDYPDVLVGCIQIA